MVASRSYRRNVANGASAACERTGWQAVRSPDWRAGRDSRNFVGEAQTPARRDSLDADGHSLLWQARLFCFALTLSKMARLPSLASKLACPEGRQESSEFLATASVTAKGKGRSFTRTTQGAKILGIHADQRPRSEHPPRDSEKLCHLVSQRYKTPPLASAGSDFENRNGRAAPSSCLSCAWGALPLRISKYG
jgi:hypothetical protein